MHGCLPFGYEVVCADCFEVQVAVASSTSDPIAIFSSTRFCRSGVVVLLCSQHASFGASKCGLHVQNKAGLSVLIVFPPREAPMGVLGRRPSLRDMGVLLRFLPSIVGIARKKVMEGGTKCLSMSSTMRFDLQSDHQSVGERRWTCSR